MIVSIFAIIFAAYTLNVKKPEHTLDSFVRSMKAYDFESAKKFYSEDIDEAKKYSNEMVENNEFSSNANYKELENEFRDLMSNLSYEIKSVKVSEQKDSAIINADFYYIDASKSIVSSVEEVFKQVFDSMFDGKEYSTEEVEDMTIESMTKGLKDLPRNKTKTSGDIYLIREEKEWKISYVEENILKALAFGVFQEEKDTEKSKENNKKDNKSEKEDEEKTT